MGGGGVGLNTRSGKKWVALDCSSIALPFYVVVALFLEHIAVAYSYLLNGLDDFSNLRCALLSFLCKFINRWHNNIFKISNRCSDVLIYESDRYHRATPPNKMSFLFINLIVVLSGGRQSSVCPLWVAEFCFFHLIYSWK